MVNNDCDVTCTTVYCPVCSEVLGEAREDEICSFICRTEGCSQTKHSFYPGNVKSPGKSVPWADYHEKKTKCGCPACASRE